MFSLPSTIEILHELKLPNQLISSIDLSHGIYQKSTLSSSSSISLAETTNSTQQIDTDHSPSETISLFDWITAQVTQLASRLFVKTFDRLVSEHESG